MESKNLIKIAENYISSLRKLEEVDQRTSLLLDQQAKLNEEILKIEEEYGKFDYTDRMRGRITRVIPCDSFDIPVIKLSRPGPKVLDFGKSRKLTRFLTVVQEKYRRLNSKKFKINTELQNLEEERERLYDKINAIDAGKLGEELAAEREATKRRLELLNDMRSKISRRRKALEETLAINNKMIKEVFYRLGVNFETAFDWYLEERFTPPGEKEEVRQAEHFLSIYLKRKQFEYIEDYFSSLINSEKEKLSKIESYVERFPLNS